MSFYSSEITHDDTLVFEAKQTFRYFLSTILRRVQNVNSSSASQEEQDEYLIDEICWLLMDFVDRGFVRIEIFVFRSILTSSFTNDFVR